MGRPLITGERLCQVGNADNPSLDPNCHCQACERCLCGPPPAKLPVATGTGAGSAEFSHVDENPLLANPQSHETLQLLL